MRARPCEPSSCVGEVERQFAPAGGVESRPFDRHDAGDQAGRSVAGRFRRAVGPDPNCFAIRECRSPRHGPEPGRRNWRARCVRRAERGAWFSRTLARDSRASAAGPKSTMFSVRRRRSSSVSRAGIADRSARGGRLREIGRQACQSRSSSASAAISSPPPPQLVITPRKSLKKGWTDPSWPSPQRTVRNLVG